LIYGIKWVDDIIGGFSFTLRRSGDNQSESWDSSAGYIRSESFLKSGAIVVITSCSLAKLLLALSTVMKSPCQRSGVLSESASPFIYRTLDMVADESNQTLPPRESRMVLKIILFSNRPTKCVGKLPHPRITAGSLISDLEIY